MYLPETLQRKRYVEWNHVVKGLVIAWEEAHDMGIHVQVEELLLADHEARLSERLSLLGHIGNRPLLQAYLRTLVPADSPAEWSTAARRAFHNWIGFGPQSDGAGHTTAATGAACRGQDILHPHPGLDAQ